MFYLNESEKTFKKAYGSILLAMNVFLYSVVIKEAWFSHYVVECTTGLCREPFKIINLIMASVSTSHHCRE